MCQLLYQEDLEQQHTFSILERLADLFKVVMPVNGVRWIPKPLLLTSIAHHFSIEMEEAFSTDYPSGFE